MMKIYQNVMVALLCVAFITEVSWAADKYNYEIDVYKYTSITPQELKRKFHRQLQQATDVIMEPGAILDEKNLQKFATAMNEINADLKNRKEYSYVDLPNITYSGAKTCYFTLDLVEKSDRKRQFTFLPKPIASYPDPHGVLKQWHEYNDMGFREFYTTRQAHKIENCPAFHCVFGFEEPKFKKYLQSFDEAANKNTQQLVNIIKYDRDEIKRGDAIYVLAHLKDGQKLVKLITPSIRDSSSYVRNSAMRVLGMTLEKVKVDHFPIDQVIEATTYPSVTDRNKALYVLESLVRQHQYVEYTKRHAGDALMDALKLIQPNNHDGAYIILKIISGKNYSDKDIAAWQKWVNENKHANV